VRDRMQWKVVGAGRPLVLIGGGLTGWASWAPFVDHFAETRSVARLQLLSVGLGLAGRPLPPDYSVELESRALAGALDAIGWNDAVDIVAWSYGALVTLDFALDHPERIRTLTLIEPPAFWLLPDAGKGDPDVEALHALAELTRDDVTDVDLELFIRIAGLVPPGREPRDEPQWPVWYEHRFSLKNNTAPLVHRDDVARLHTFDRPVLLVTGTGTSPFLRNAHDRLAAELPNATAIEMPAGHAPHLVSADRFLDELQRFQQALE
jgi:pimeloyl-ACP methyl ester carboxylesterase